MQKLMVMLLALMLAITWLPALAAPGDGVPFRQTDEHRMDLQSAAVIGDTLYVSTWSDVYRYRVSDAEPTKLTFENNDNGSIRALVNNAGKLSALYETWAVGTQEIGCKLVDVFVDESDKISISEGIKLEWEDMLIRDGENTYTRSFEGVLVNEGRLFLLAVDRNWQSSTLMCFDMTNGSCTPMEQYDEIIGIAAYKPEQLLVQLHKHSDDKAPARIGILDLATSRVTEPFEIKVEPYYDVFGLAYTPDTDTIYYVASGQIYEVKGMDNANAVIINDMPIKNDSIIARSGQLMNGGFYVMYNSEALLVRNTDPTQKPTRTLNIKGDIQMDDAYYTFTASHPDVAVVIDDKSYHTYRDEVTKAMMNQDSAFDIYLLPISGPDFHALYNRNYLTELTDPTVGELIGRMYPTISQALMKDGKIFALPMTFDNSGLMSIDKEVMIKLKLTEDDLPKTWAQMIEFLGHWGQIYGQDYPEVTPLDPFAMTDIRSNLLSCILNNYMAYMENNGIKDFNTPELRELLAKLDAADFTDIQTEEQGNIVVWTGENALFTNQEKVGFSNYRNQNMVIWPLSIVKGEEPLIPLELSVCVINPFSQNQDIAQEYVSACAKRISRAMRLTLCPDENEPIRQLGYEQNIIKMEEQLEKLKKQFEEAAPDEKAIYEGLTREYERYIQDYEQNAWLASAEDIAIYRERADQLVISKFSGFGGQDEEMLSLINRYIDRQIPAEHFISGYDQKLRMMEAEGY